MFNETKIQAIKRLFKEGYNELYVVDCYITDQTHLMSTWLWNIYANRKDAELWIKLCKNCHSSQDYYWEYYDFTELDKKLGFVCSYFYNDGNTEMLERFRLRRYIKR